MSIILPTHRPNPYFSETIASIRAQVFRDWELIVVDDGWRRPEMLADAVGEGASARVLRQAPAGISAARNHGLENARGSLVAFVDHDDVWTPEHLQHLSDALRLSPEALAAYSMCDVINGAGEVVSSARAIGPFSRLEMLRGGQRPSITSLLTRRAVLDRIGGFRAEMEPADDIDLLYRLAEEGTFAYVPTRTASYRRHSSNVSNDVRLVGEAGDKVLVAHHAAARRRGDLVGARLLHANVVGSRRYWAKEARHAAGRSWRAGSRRNALTLLGWSLRFAPRAAIVGLFVATHSRARRAAHVSVTGPR